MCRRCPTASTDDTRTLFHDLLHRTCKRFWKHIVIGLPSPLFWKTCIRLYNYRK
ncbi:hypothetical protein EVA_17494 [gut metagenome]|uniref:Uncharacterized protein n=1 Tax=gut metagenome TaxID=749906 RepID=J9G4D3_9ZZZZ